MFHMGESRFQRPSANPSVGLVLAFLGILGFLSPWGNYAVGYGASGNGWESYEALEANYKFSLGPLLTVALSSLVIALGINITRNQWQGKPSNRQTIAVSTMSIGVLLFGTGYVTNRALGQLFSENGYEFNQGFGLWLANVVSVAVIFCGLVILQNDNLTDGI